MHGKMLRLLVAFMLFVVADVNGQVIIHRRAPGRFYRQPKPVIRERLPRFEPTLNISIGYGVPNLDKDFLPEYFNAYRDTYSQNGPVTGSIDYRFSRRMSIGVIVTHGTVSAPYYDYYSSSGRPAFQAKLENWSFMLNLVRYLPAGKKVTPYMRTAVGINAWKQEYTDADHNRLSMPPADLPDFAYQVGLGAQFKLTKNAGLYVEAGYGKYIANGGLNLRF